MPPPPAFLHGGCSSEQHRSVKFPPKLNSELAEDDDVIGLQKMKKKTPPVPENIHHDQRVARGSTFAIHRDSRGGCDALATVNRSLRRGKSVFQLVQMTSNNRSFCVRIDNTVGVYFILDVFQIFSCAVVHGYSCTSDVLPAFPPFRLVFVVTYR